VSKAWDSIKLIGNKISEFFTSGFFQKIVEFIKCIVNDPPRAMVQGIIDTVKGFNSKIQNLLQVAGGAVAGVVVWVVDFIIALICQWKLFKQAIDNLANGIKSTGNARWKNIGSFIGIVINAVGTAPMSLSAMTLQ